jgi:hypothetical protein
MGDALAKIVQGEQRQSDRARQDALPPGERSALRTIRIEAKKAGSYLASGGKGGLPPSLVLGVFRRDKWRCKACGELGTRENGGLSVHHKGGIPESKWLQQKGHSNDPNNIVAICNNCHDRIHEEARDEGIDGGG